MPSLWTPEGEHRVENEAPTPGTPPPGHRPPERAGLDTTGDEKAPERPRPGERTAEEAELEAEMARLQAELLGAPVEDVVMNHCLGLFQLAVLHLSQNPPNLDAARFSTDALALLVEGLGDRLGEHEPTLRDALTSIRLTYVQLAKAPGASGDGGGVEQATKDRGEPT